VAEVTVSDTVPDAATGVTHVYLLQRRDGFAVVNGLVNIAVGQGGTVLHVANRFVADLAAATAGQTAASARPSTGPAEAADIAAAHVGSAQERAVEPAELVWQPLDDGTVRLAWSLVIEPPGGEHWWVTTVDVQTGEVLQTFDLVVHDDVTAIGNALARAEAPAAAAAGPAQTVDDGSSYRVFPLPLESPSAGERALVNNPASATASPFGWHDTNGVAGPEFTRTQGNNVHAYADRSNDNQPDPGTDPDGGPGLDFDFPLDVTRRPLDSRDAIVTNLFYWSNVIHDVMHGYGFDEASGNFQVNSYGRGGLGGDDVRAEAQDGSGRNNANFNTPVDGQRPRMQMYEWRSSAPNPIVVAPPSTIAGTYFGPMAGFGESLVTTGPITGEVVEVGRGLRSRLPGRAAARSVPGRPGRKDRAHRPRQLHVRGQGEEGPGPRGDHGDRRQQRSRSGDRDGRRRPNHRHPVGHGQPAGRHAVQGQRSLHRHHLRRHRRRP
jgi:hypothetical protein